MTDHAANLRRLYEATASNRATDYTGLLDAADHIERLERQAGEVDEWMRDNMPEFYGQVRR